MFDRLTIPSLRSYHSLVKNAIIISGHLSNEYSLLGVTWLAACMNNIAMLAPAIDYSSIIKNIQKPVLVQTASTKPNIERLDKCIQCHIARLNDALLHLYLTTSENKTLLVFPGSLFIIRLLGSTRCLCPYNPVHSRYGISL